MFVQCAGNQFFAGARLAGDQHRHAGAREPADRAEHLLHRRCAAEQLGHAGRGFRGRIRRAVALCSTLHEVDDLIDVERLRQIFEGTTFVRGYGITEIGLRRHDDHRQTRPRRANLAQQFEPRLSGHTDVGQQNVRCFATQSVEGGFCGFETSRHETAALQRALEHPANRCIVVDDPDVQAATVHERLVSGNVKENTVLPGSL